ncbi:hypothetical protein NUITMVRA1_16370 [Aerococcus viridans]|uniref:glycosyltransferase family 2 protein n=1 Tax=Aerococcus viridans TaxID=1377 RepID=UPI0028FD0779|nr:hypothetical protein NUITMVRA1_16370 [Aerococcus viridans]
MPKVSVIMAEYNTPRNHFNLAVESILNQTFSDFEFIIVDDSKDQHLEEYMNNYPDVRVKLVKNGGNFGLVYSLNNAISVAQSDYLVRMDTDDISLPDRIKVLYEEITNNPEFSVIGTSFIEFDDKGKYSEFIYDREYTFKIIMNRQVPIHPTTILKKQDIISVGNYKEFNRAEDFVLWCELLLKGYRIKTIPKVLYKYRVSESDLDKRKLKYRKDEIRARIKYYRLMGANPLQMLSISKSIIAGIVPNKIMYLYHNLRK